MFNIPYTQKIFKNRGYFILDTYTPYAKVYLKEYTEAYHVVLFADNYAGFLKSRKNVELLKEKVIADLQAHFYDKEILVLFVMKAGFDTYIEISEMDNVFIISPKGKCVIKGDISRCFADEMEIIRLSKKIGYKIQKLDKVENKLDENYGSFGIYILVMFHIFVTVMTFGKNDEFAIGVKETLADENLLSLVMYMFCHGSIGHFVGNMISLIFIGRNVENTMGMIKTYLIYVGGGIYAGIISCCYKVYTHSMSPTVGASGGIFALLGAYTILAIMYAENKKKALLKTTLYAVILIATGFLNPATDNACHIGGFIAGILITLFIIMTEQTLENIKITHLIRSRMKAEDKAYARKV